MFDLNKIYDYLYYDIRNLRKRSRDESHYSYLPKPLVLVKPGTAKYACPYNMATHMFFSADDYTVLIRRLRSKILPKIAQIISNTAHEHIAKLQLDLTVEKILPIDLAYLLCRAATSPISYDDFLGSFQSNLLIGLNNLLVNTPYFDEELKDPIFTRVIAQTKDWLHENKFDNILPHDKPYQYEQVRKLQIIISLEEKSPIPSDVLIYSQKFNKKMPIYFSSLYSK